MKITAFYIEYTEDKIDYAVFNLSSFLNNIFKIIGVAMEEQIISKITAVKYSALIIPADIHFCVAEMFRKNLPVKISTASLNRSS